MTCDRFFLFIDKMDTLEWEKLESIKIKAYNCTAQSVALKYTR